MAIAAFAVIVAFVVISFLCVIGTEKVSSTLQLKLYSHNFTLFILREITTSWNRWWSFWHCKWFGLSSLSFSEFTGKFACPKRLSSAIASWVSTRFMICSDKSVQGWIWGFELILYSFRSQSLKLELKLRQKCLSLLFNNFWSKNKMLWTVQSSSMLLWSSEATSWWIGPLRDPFSLATNACNKRWWWQSFRQDSKHLRVNCERLLRRTVWCSVWVRSRTKLGNRRESSEWGKFQRQDLRKGSLRIDLTQRSFSEAYRFFRASFQSVGDEFRVACRSGMEFRRERSHMQLPVAPSALLSCISCSESSSWKCFYCRALEFLRSWRVDIRL